MTLSGITPIAAQASSLLKILGMVVAAILATLSWKYVEQPFRTGPRRPSRAALFRIAGAAAAVLAVVVGSMAAT
jgi:peptidoglycan/LPS O-acetylase OafA/YrhL